MRESVRFDRAVAFYDKTRGLAPDLAAKQADLLHAELRGADSVLEIGVGTGRIALTLDVPLVGLDLSRPMMLELKAKGGTLPLIEGDATRLPFADATFGAAYAAHVFHLIPTWEAAFAELVRVVRPGGVLLTVRGSGRSDVGRAITARFFDALGRRNRAVGADRIEAVDEVALRHGLGVRVLPPIERTDALHVGEFLDTWERGEWSGIWDLAPAERRAAAAVVRAWLVEEYGSAEAEVPATSSFAWHAYDLPS